LATTLLATTLLAATLLAALTGLLGLLARILLAALTTLLATLAGLLRLLAVLFVRILRIRVIHPGAPVSCLVGMKTMRPRPGCSVQGRIMVLQYSPDVGRPDRAERCDRPDVGEEKTTDELLMEVADASVNWQAAA
jgi:hypothetical protein